MGTCRSLLLPAAVAALLILHGCGGTNQTINPFPEVAPPGTVVRSAKARNTAPVVSAADMAALAAGNREFACALYQRLARGDGNLVFSPLSISTALAMA
ncbi:MAG TPA: serpin family protein, partial [Armatimonadota bacterium]|nr:serpin family protein [Armatimonadota bacterium]